MEGLLPHGNYTQKISNEKNFLDEISYPETK